MKKRIFCIFAILLVLSFPACANQSSYIEKPADFYYCTSSISFESEQGVIASEIRESALYQHDLTALINYYMRGPSSTNLTSPFPTGSAVLWINQNNDGIILVMNQQFSQLTGINLSLACSCLSKTVFSVLDTESITIRCRESTLDGNETITMTRDSILIQDKARTPLPAE